MRSTLWAMMFGDCALPSNMYSPDVIVTFPVAATEFSTMGPVELIVDVRWRQQCNLDGELLGVLL